MPASGFKKLASTTAVAIFLAASAAPQSSAPESTAWHDGRFQIDTAKVLSRSDIILDQPNLDSGQAMPLGDGDLGVAIWSENGFTAQLNRADTLPGRLSAGQVVIPGVAALTSAKDYSGRLALYDGEFQESGSGMTVTAYVEPLTATLHIDVTGANPNQSQTAQLKLWSPRHPKAEAGGSTGTLAETWIDNANSESSGRTFGSFAGITARGRNVTAAVTDPLTITVSFQPDTKGNFNVLVAAPHYDGRARPTLWFERAAVAGALPHRAWWHNFWSRATPIEIHSPDGSGEYMENLRNIYLFDAAADKGGEYPGSQAGVADMLSSGGDQHKWDPGAFWHWNLRMQVAANIGAGVSELNAPFFNLYRENLENIEAWTKLHMNGLPGICIPETMRFNGRGAQFEPSWKPPSNSGDCNAGFRQYYNARTLTTGAEVSLWIWEQYLSTDDRAFLEKNYPVIAESARFLLAYQKPGEDGLLHTSPSNSHETQWDVSDPLTDIAAADALYPVTIGAVKLLGKDGDLVEKLQAALPKIPLIPRTQAVTPATGMRSLLAPAEDAAGDDVIAESYLPGAPNHNSENIGLETLWPYAIVGDRSPLFDLARRTYEHRLFVDQADWSYDPIDAARLEMGGEVADNLVKITERYQHSPNGLANWAQTDHEFYIEQVGVVADALQECLAQDYDGVIRIAPAAPPTWDLDGSVYVRGKTKVDVQVHQGQVTTAVIEAGETGVIEVRNPWPNQKVNVFSGAGNGPIAVSMKGQVLTWHAEAGQSYIVGPTNTPIANLPFAAISGEAASAPKKLGPVQIGLAGPTR
jgi:alpha-L-fucosidase 2